MMITTIAPVGCNRPRSGLATRNAHFEDAGFLAPDYVDEGPNKEESNNRLYFIDYFFKIAVATNCATKLSVLEYCQDRKISGSSFLRQIMISSRCETLHGTVKS